MGTCGERATPDGFGAHGHSSPKHLPCPLLQGVKAPSHPRVHPWDTQNSWPIEVTRKSKRLGLSSQHPFGIVPWASDPKEPLDRPAPMSRSPGHHPLDPLTARIYSSLCTRSSLSPMTSYSHTMYSKPSIPGTRHTGPFASQPICQA